MDQTVIDKIKASFARQSYMTTLGAALDHIETGSISIRAPCRIISCNNTGLHMRVLRFLWGIVQQAMRH